MRRHFSMAQKPRLVERRHIWAAWINAYVVASRNGDERALRWMAHATDEERPKSTATHASILLERVLADIREHTEPLPCNDPYSLTGFDALPLSESQSGGFCWGPCGELRLYEEFDVTRYARPRRGRSGTFVYRGYLECRSCEALSTNMKS